MTLIDAQARLFAFARRNNGCFRLADAIDAGLCWDAIEHRRATGEWIEVHTGVFRLAGAPDTWWGRLRCACWAGGAHAAVSGRAAAAVFRLPGGSDRIVEITCPRWRRTKTNGLLVHESNRLSPADLTMIDRIAFLRVERVVLDLAARHPDVDYVERVLHAARRQQLVTFASMRGTVDALAGKGRRGITATRAALDRWYPEQRPTESDMETLLLQAMRAHGLPEPELQFVVHDDAGNFVARTDAGLPGFRITLEYDSMQEHVDEISRARDDARRNRIAALGYTHLVARYHDLRAGGHEVCTAIRTAMERAA